MIKASKVIGLLLQCGILLFFHGEIPISWVITKITRNIIGNGVFSSSQWPKAIFIILKIVISLFGGVG